MFEKPIEIPDVSPEDPNYQFLTYVSPWRLAQNRGHFAHIAEKKRNKELAENLRYPDPYYWEDQYSNLLQGIVTQFNSQIMKIVEEDLHTDAMYLDISKKLKDKLLRFLSFIQPKIENTFGEEIQRIANGINAYQSRNFQKQMQKIAINIRDTPSGGLEVNDFVNYNTQKISSLLEEEVIKVQNIISGNPTATKEQLSQTIQKQTKSTQKQADLIARNEVLTLQGSLDAQRQRNLGFTKFMWNTLKDGKVRASHKAFDGEIFSWDDLPTINGERVYPKSPTKACINCRCYTSPVI